jgi:hypothetical protein
MFLVVTLVEEEEPVDAVQLVDVVLQEEEEEDVPPIHLTYHTSHHHLHLMMGPDI